MKKFVLVAAVLFAGYTCFIPAPGYAWNVASSQRADKSSASIADAFANHQSKLQVTGQGVVVKLLPDDNSGSRHQRFIVKLSTGQTLLIAHNIDLAPRVGGLAVGDSIRFNGEYEWNAKGGVVHWTHRDPRGFHPSGWLQHQGQTYQ